MTGPAWRTSSHSCANGSCVEVAWVKSSRSGINGCVEVAWRKAAASTMSGNCVQVGQVADAVLVRDSKDPHGPQLRFTEAEWRAFRDGVKGGEFDAPPD